MAVLQNSLFFHLFQGKTGTRSPFAVCPLFHPITIVVNRGVNEMLYRNLGWAAYRARVEPRLTPCCASRCFGHGTVIATTLELKIVLGITIISECRKSCALCSSEGRLASTLSNLEPQKPKGLRARMNVALDPAHVCVGHVLHLYIIPVPFTVSG